MKKIKFAIPVFAILIYACYKNPNNSEEDELQKTVEKIKEQFVPDKRVNVFDIEIKNKDGKTTIYGTTTILEAKNELIKQIKEKTKNIVDSIKILPENKLGDKIYGIVTLSVASMRTAGKYSAEMATQATLGTPVKILQHGEWFRIQTPDNYISYTYSGNIKAMNKEEFNDWILSPKIIFTDNYGFAYTNTDCKSVVSDLVAGDMLKLESEDNQYFKVAYPDGRIAFVKKTQAKTFEKWYKSINLTGEDIVNYAKKFMGVPYLWGGTSAKSFDCSGFVKTVYFMHGIVLQRDASQQCYTGKNIELTKNYGNLETGDLLFFGKKSEGGKKERIGHVAIYMGNNKFIHESTQVKIGSLNPNDSNYDEYNTNRLIRASRIIGSIDTKGISTLKDNEMYNVK